MTSSLVERCVTSRLSAVSAGRSEIPVELITPMVTRLGPARALGWCGWNLPRYDQALAQFGTLRTHLLATTICLLNNSEWFTRSQGAALRQSYFQNYGRHFPLDEADLMELRGRSPALVRHRMLDAARQAGLHAEIPWLSRTIALATAPVPCPADRDDRRLLHLVRMFDTLAELAEIIPSYRTLAETDANGR